MKELISGRRFILALMSKKGMITFNLTTFVIAVISVASLYRLYVNPADNIKEIDDILNAIATIFVAYGVALEERETIYRIYSPVQGAITAVEEKLNHLCHDFGLMFLVVALFVEVTSEVVKIPGEIFKTPFVEETMVFSGMALTLYMLAKLFVFTIKLTHANDGNLVNPAERR